MKKVLIVYFSLTGKTERMAQFISEGVRIGGLQATTSKANEIKNVSDISGYDGYIFGSPTYHKEIAEPMKTFMFLARKADLEGKLAGAFGSYTHSADAPGMIFDTMQYVYKMIPFNLGSFKLTEAVVDTSVGMRACQDYGKAFAETLGA